MTTYELDFSPGDVSVQSEDIELIQIASLIFQAGTVSVLGSQLTLDLYTADNNLFFEPGLVSVSSEQFEIRQTGQSLNFQPGDVRVTAPRVQLLLDPSNLKFIPGDVTVTGTFIELKPIPVINPPAIRPTTRSYTPPKFQFTQLVMEDGTVVGEILCDKPSGPQVDLTFANIDSSTALEFLQAWEKALGRTLPITVPLQWSQGTKKAMRDLLRNPGDGAVWKFAEKPRVQFNIAPGIADVAVRIASIVEGDRNGRNSVNMPRLPQEADPLIPVFVDADEPLNCGFDGGGGEEGGGEEGGGPVDFTEWLYVLRDFEGVDNFAMEPGIVYSLILQQVQSLSTFTGSIYWKIDSFLFINGIPFSPSMIIGDSEGVFSTTPGANDYNVQTLQINDSETVVDVWVSLGVSREPITGDVFTFPFLEQLFIFSLNRTV